MFNEGFQPSIKLDWVFLNEMGNFIEEYDNSTSLRNSFREIIIVNPQTSVQEFVEEKGHIFTAWNWSVSVGEYTRKKRGVSSCCNTLFIRPTETLTIQ